MRLNLQKQLVVRILLSAYRLVEEVFKNDKDAFLRTPAQQLKEKTVFIPYSEDRKEEYNILVFPEAYACLMPLIKQNKIVEINMALSGLVKNEWNIIGTFPESYRPRHHIVGYGVDGNSNFCHFQLSSNGEFKTKPLSGTYCYLTLNYFCN